jgi:hypothetical protein
MAATKREQNFQLLVVEARALLPRVRWDAVTPRHATVLRGLEDFLASPKQMAAARVLYVHYALVRPVVHFLMGHMLRRCPMRA